MENKQICQVYGNDIFATGQVGSITSEGNVRPIGSIMATGLLTFHLLKKILIDDYKPKNQLLYK
ncbi:hypothetical protein AB1J28_12285 [Lysinibacillus irui]|uniref:hypothetical protein n=1 Tax=Lysinibacillus irui TaxID=2998077 RepID=UPI002AD34287|nr:hypothetical protein [Lysinibacillus irui]MEA0562281.1 hypothetical protein [Lysinibacillus irui]